MPIVSPFGLSPFGLADATGVVPRAGAPVIAAELIDQNSRDIASVTRSANVIDAQVQIALTVERGSGPAVQDVGQRFRDVGKLTENAKALLEAEARTALGQLVERGDITIDSVAVVIDSPNTWAEVTVNYINQRVRKNKEQSYTHRIQAATR